MGLGLPDLRGLVKRTERLPFQQLQTVYFDTPDGRLWDQGITLRHRMTQDDMAGRWTLKLPAAVEGSTLNRTEVSWSGPREEIPQSARTIVQGLVRRQSLQPLVELDSTRQRLLLRDAAEHTLAEIDDDTVTVKGGPRDGLRFRQVELEVHDADAKIVHKVTAQLKGAGLSPESTPKLVRALGLPISPATGRQLGRNSSLGDVVRAVLIQGLTRLLDHDWRLRAAGNAATPEDVHQARVATRRLRSDLRTFDGVLDPIWVSHVRSDLKWLGSALGDVRDTDVLAGQIEGAPDEIELQLFDQRTKASERLRRSWLPIAISFSSITCTRQRTVRPFSSLETTSTRRTRPEGFFRSSLGPVGVPYVVRSASQGTTHQTSVCTASESSRSNSATRLRRRRRSWAKRLGGLRRPPRISKRCSAITMMPSRPNRGSEHGQKTASPPPVPSRPVAWRLASSAYSASFGVDGFGPGHHSSGQRSDAG